MKSYNPNNRTDFSNLPGFADELLHYLCREHLNPIDVRKLARVNKKLAEIASDGSWDENYWKMKYLKYFKPQLKIFLPEDNENYWQVQFRDAYFKYYKRFNVSMTLVDAIRDRDIEFLKAYNFKNRFFEGINEYITELLTIKSPSFFMLEYDKSGLFHPFFDVLKDAPQIIKNILYAKTQNSKLPKSKIIDQAYKILFHQDLEELTYNFNLDDYKSLDENRFYLHLTARYGNIDSFNNLAEGFSQNISKSKHYFDLYRISTATNNVIIAKRIIELDLIPDDNRIESVNFSLQHSNDLSIIKTIIHFHPEFTITPAVYNYFESSLIISPIKGAFIYFVEQGLININWIDFTTILTVLKNRKNDIELLEFLILKGGLSRRHPHSSLTIPELCCIASSNAFKIMLESGEINPREHNLVYYLASRGFEKNLLVLLDYDYSLAKETDGNTKTLFKYVINKRNKFINQNKMDEDLPNALISRYPNIINEPYDDVNLPIFYAIKMLDIPFLKYLLDKKVNLNNLQSNFHQNKSALNFLVSEFRRKIDAQDTISEIFELLLNHGARLDEIYSERLDGRYYDSDCKRKTNRGVMTTYEAILTEDSLSYLTNTIHHNKIARETPDKIGNTLFIISIFNRNYNAFNNLISEWNVNEIGIKNGKKQTALYASMNDAAIFFKLLDKGADSEETEKLIINGEKSYKIKKFKLLMKQYEDLKKIDKRIKDLREDSPRCKNNLNKSDARKVKEKEISALENLRTKLSKILINRYNHDYKHTSFFISHEEGKLIKKFKSSSRLLESYSHGYKL